MADDWFVCRVKAHKLATNTLRNDGFDVYAPTTPIECFRHHRLYIQNRPLFGPYILISFDVRTSQWQKINTTMGVVRLLPMHREIPEAIPPDYVPKLMELLAKEEQDTLSKALDLTRGYAEGDYVEVKRGHMAGFGGKFLGVRNRQMHLLLSCFGRLTKFKIPPACVDPKEEKAADKSGK